MPIRGIHYWSEFQRRHDCWRVTYGANEKILALSLDILGENARK